MTTITFTGHRDKHCPTRVLDYYRENYPDSVWLQGGAKGVDTDVYNYCIEHDIPWATYKPDYKKYYWKVAPLRRNEQMINNSSFVVAIYDGRLTGGTKQAIEYAKGLGKEVFIFEPKNMEIVRKV